MTASRFKAVAALAGAFVLGGVCSAAAVHALEREDWADFFRGERGTIEARRVEALARELDLTNTQAAAVRGVFEKHADERRRLMRQAMETCGGPLNAQRDRIDAEIRAILTPAQRPKLDTLRAERRKRLFGEPSPSDPTR